MENDLVLIRQEKLNKLREKKIIPYADRYECTHTVNAAMNLPDENIARIAGRIMAVRDFGKLAFVDIKDRSGKGQLSFKKSSLDENTWWMLREVIDIGDFVGVEGKMWTTRTGEKTLEVTNMKFLTKGLHPLPEKWHGIKDKELSSRKRYLDLLMNSETQERFETRVKVIKSIRRFLDERGFLEVETPILQMAASGASARPFVTHHNALDEDFYLRISPETFLKRLVVGGLERVYEIGKNFRNEGIDASHLQEFTMLEWYAAYWNYEDNMQFVRELIQHVLQEILGTTSLEYQGLTLDFGGEWAKVDYREVLIQEIGIDIFQHNSRDELAGEIKRQSLGIDVEKYPSLPSLIDALYKKTVRPKIIQPTFLLHHPTVLVPLARRNDHEPMMLDMFQVVVNSWEVAKAYSELVDPVDQRNRMNDQREFQNEGDDETMMMEEDYIECMEYGMPPNSGLGLGIDRIVALITNAESLRDVVFFPNMRRDVDG